MPERSAAGGRWHEMKVSCSNALSFASDVVREIGES